MKNKKNITAYKELLDDIRTLLQRARSQAYKAVDNIRVQTYWQIGERIVREGLKYKRRSAYSARIIEKLAKDLGFTRAVLYRILQFYKTYPIVVTLSRQLSWSHYEVLITIASKEKREFYEQQTLQNQWSIRNLREQIRKRLFERRIKNITNHKISRAITSSSLSPEKFFKDTYSFDFLKLPKTFNEEELEKALFSNVEKLLLEFGSDFSLSGRQRKIIIDRQVHTVDLEFFHRGIPCVVLVDLKIRKFKSEHVGKMNKYLNYYRENKKYPWERAPIGLIICADKGKEEIHYALGNLANRIFISKYRVKLPSEKNIAKKLKRLKPGEYLI